MVSLALNPVLACLDIKPTDRIIVIRECGIIDANFLLSHLMKQIFIDEHQLCLLLLHNTITHYHSVGKRLGYDLLKRINDGCVKTIEPLHDIINDIDNDDCDNRKFLKLNHQQIVHDLYQTIKNSLDDLLIKSTTTSKRVYLMIDDLSHLLDLGIDYKLILTFTNYCLNLINNERICIVINTHVCESKFQDQIIANNLNYLSDVFIDVLPLKTGYSKEVSGMLIVDKLNGSHEKAKYHFKTYDKGVRTFNLGESIYNLYR